ncbi:MAG TPA: molybdopterin-dependent oxidoreductase, partial [Acidimicrobiia bacterium]|nr:molybdopterin-dependent oxidoreductase [Acidimicrobiia bacterium]
MAAVLGAALGITFTACFVTGVLSHLIQDPPAWFHWPSRPAGLYRVTQGVHVVAGIASIPLLLAKLWVVYPKLFEWPPTRSVAHAVERLALLPLIGGGLFLAFTGVANINIWRPWEFGFRPGHYWAAWITMGALAVHLGAKGTATRTLLFPPSSEAAPDPTESGNEAEAVGLSRRGFLATAFGASGFLTLFSIGQTVRPLRALALIVPRRPDIGPQGLPVNRTARSAGVVERAFDPGYRLVVDGAGARRPLALSLNEIRALPQYEAVLPIACVEGWSFEARWRGVRVRDLVEMAGGDEDAEARVHSFQRGNRLKTSDLNHSHTSDRDTLLALEVNGEALDVEHGYPLRLIGPNRPGVMQTK